jgi:regulator of sigma D
MIKLSNDEYETFKAMYEQLILISDQLSNCKIDPDKIYKINKKLKKLGEGVQCKT